MPTLSGLLDEIDTFSKTANEEEKKLKDYKKTSLKVNRLLVPLLILKTVLCSIILGVERLKNTIKIKEELSQWQMF